MVTWQQEQQRVAEVGRIFDVDYRDAQTEIIQDDGLHRHVRVVNPRSSMYHFNLVTWPGYLAVSGDVESFTFRREPDMFGFFGRNRARINPGYWAEKCVAGRDQLTSYDEKHARQLVIESFVESARHGGVPRGTGKAIRDWILEDEEFGHEEGAHRLLRDFRHGSAYSVTCIVPRCHERSRGSEERAYVERWAKAHEADNPGHTAAIVPQPAFTFNDTYEWDLTCWNHHFLYACHAITWGIGRYWARKNLPPRLWAKYGRG